MRDKYYGYKHSLRQYAAILYRTYPPGFAIFLVRVRVRVGVRVRVRVRGSGLGLDSLPVFHIVMAGCFSRSSWRRSDPLACGS